MTLGEGGKAQAQMGKSLIHQGQESEWMLAKVRPFVNGEPDQKVLTFRIRSDLLRQHMEELELKGWSSVALKFHAFFYTQQWTCVSPSPSAPHHFIHFQVWLCLFSPGSHFSSILSPYGSAVITIFTAGWHMWLRPHQSQHWTPRNHLDIIIVIHIFWALSMCWHDPKIFPSFRSFN